MNERIKEKGCIKAFVVFLLAQLVLASSCGKNISFDEMSADIPPANKTAFYAVAKEIKQIVRELDYPDEVGPDLVKIIGGLKYALWKQKLDQAKNDLLEKKISATQVAEVEKDVARELYQLIEKSLSAVDDPHYYDYYDLGKAIKDRRANCFSYSQLFYIVGNSLGLAVEIVDVIERATGSSPVEGGHVACLVGLSDTKIIMVDLTYHFVSKPFVFKEEFDEIGNYWEIRDKNNPLGIPRRIQIWDRNGILAGIYHCRGFEFLESGKYTEAISEYTKSIKINPKCAVTYINRGSAYANLGRYNEAISDYYKATELDPKNIYAYCRRGRMYLQMGQSAEAISDLNKAIQLDPKNANAYIDRGYIHGILGQYEDAVTDFTKAIINVFYSRGQTYYYSGDWNKVISDYTKVIELDPENVDAYCSRGAAYCFSAHYSQAISDFDKAIKINPKNSNAYFGRGSTHRGLGQYNEGISDLTKAIELDPNNILAYFGRGISYRELGQYNESISDLTKAIELNPNYTVAYLMRRSL